MLRNLKNYLKLGILLFGISIFLVNCQKDDYEISEASETVSEKPFPFEFKTKTYNELSKESKFNTAIDKTFNIKNSNSTARTVMEEQYGFTIDSTLIKEISSGTYVSYTFLIYRDTSSKSYFENLVVKIDSSNNITAAIVKYTLNSDIVIIEEHNSFLIDAKMEVTYINYNSNFAKVSAECVGIWMCPWGDLGDHPATQTCIDEERGDLFLDTSMCTDSGGGGGSTGGTEDGSTGGTEDDSSNDTSCETCGASGGGTTGETSTTDGVTVSVLSPEEVSFNSFIEGLDPEVEFWINQIDQIILKSNTFDYLKANFFSTEAEAFAELVVEAGANGTLISAFPFVKYPPNSNYANLYPKLTEYLKNQLPTLKNNSTIINAIKTYTSQTTAQIQQHLQWGQGPTIRIEQLGTAYGKFKKSTDPDSLYLDIDLVNQLESTTPNSNLANAFAFLIGVTVLHEYVHYGDYNYNGDFWQYPQEEGLLFETDVYGQSVWIHNAEIILKGN